MEKSDRDKLKILLEYWVKHNAEHTEEFREWAEKSEQSGENEINNDILEAVGYMEKVNERLINALNRIKGDNE